MGLICICCSLLTYLKKNKHGKEPDPISFFRATHTRKDDSWIDESSQQRGVNDL